MYTQLVRLKEARAWLKIPGSDCQIAYSPPPALREQPILWILRLDGYRDVLRLVRQYRRLLRARRCVGACWHAGHPLTLKWGERFATESCGRKFLRLESAAHGVQGQVKPVQSRL